MPVRPEPMQLPTQQPRSIYTCFLPHDLRNAQAARPRCPYSGGTNTEKPAEMPLPVSRGRWKAMLQRKNAALGAAFYFSLLPPPLRGRVGGGGNASTVVVATPTPNPSPQGRGEQRESKQSACRRRRHVALALHDDLVERSEIGLGGSHQRVRIGTARGHRTTFMSQSHRHFGLSIGSFRDHADLIQLHRRLRP